MGISFRDRYVYAVKAEQEDERQRFFAAAESMGIPTSRNYRDRSYVWPRDTCLFAVNPARRQIRYIAEPHICAAMVCCGARIYSVSEFLLSFCAKVYPRRTCASGQILFLRRKSLRPLPRGYSGRQGIRRHGTIPIRAAMCQTLS